SASKEKRLQGIIPAASFLFDLLVTLVCFVSYIGRNEYDFTANSCTTIPNNIMEDV
ncbi:MAG: hypothetical protein HXN99_05340, partial [Prevotella salivae]|nr:hypothetical protein [Segatella salivae]MBF1561370.1 hypothetical protein [Segatella salivae]